MSAPGVACNTPLGILQYCYVCAQLVGQLMTGLGVAREPTTLWASASKRKEPSRRPPIAAALRPLEGERWMALVMSSDTLHCWQVRPELHRECKEHLCKG